MTNLAVLPAGPLFGADIAPPCTINPDKALRFCDIFCSLDPSPTFVMAVALLVLRRSHPWFDGQLHLPDQRKPDPGLTGGSALFGIGRGLASPFCKGAIPRRGRRSPMRRSLSRRCWPVSRWRGG